MAKAITIQTNVPLEMEQKKELWAKYYGYFCSVINVSLIKVPVKMRPVLRSDESIHTFTDSNRVINIGLGMLNVCSESEFLVWCLFLIGHEVGHVLCTPAKPWHYGMQEGTRQVCIKMSEVLEGPGKRIFRKDQDIDTFCKYMQDNGIKVTRHAIEQYVHMIQNSIEDGRMERLRAKNSSLFKDRMLACRSMEWTRNPLDPEVLQEMTDPRVRLNIKLSQLLSVATKATYQKGFLELLGNDPIADEIDDFLPLVGVGVHSPTCRGGMDQAIALEKKLAEEIIEAAKMTDLEELIQQLMQQALANQMTDDEDHTTAQTNEQTGDGNGSSGSGQTSQQGQPGSSSDSSGDKPDGDANGSDHNEGYDVCSDDYFGKRNEGASAGNVDTQKAEEAFMKAAEEAARRAAENAEAYIKLHQRSSEEAAAIKRGNIDNAKPVQPVEALKEEYSDVKFQELKRQYDVNLTMPDDLQSRAKSFEKKIKDLLQPKRKKVKRNQKKGKINATALYKLATKEAEIFKVEGQPKQPKDCVAYFLADNSGSMGNGPGSKRYFCHEALAVIERGFSMLMPLKIVAFDAAGHNSIRHQVVKNFQEQSPLSYSYNFMISGPGGCCNCDGYDIRIATQELLARKEKEKLLIVLSDGTPSGSSSWESGLADVKDAVQKARDNGIVVIPVYFSDNPDSEHELAAYKEMYGEYVVSTIPENIEEEIGELMKKFYFG